MRVDTDEPEIIERVAALDVAKAEVVCCARVPGSGRQRMQEVRTVSTMTAALLELGDWLADLGVTRVVMEATSDYWRAPFYLLEDRFETWLVNAHDVKHLPGRPKTDRLDAVWLCKVAERQMLRPSFVPPPQIRLLRDLTRYRVDLLAVRTAEKPPSGTSARLVAVSGLSCRGWSARACAAALKPHAGQQPSSPLPPA
jgi:transposase